MTKLSHRILQQVSIEQPQQFTHSHGGGVVYHRRSPQRQTTQKKSKGQWKSFDAIGMHPTT